MNSIVESLLQRINIFDVISQYVKLRKAGKDFIGICPFHKEKTPSFTVSIQKQMFYCFGCHEGGNVINFLMKYENLNFNEAIENLAHQYGIKINRNERSKRSTAYDALSKLAEFYHTNLKKSKQAMDYLLKRDIDEETIDEFMIGFCDGQRYTLKYFLKNSGISNDIYFSTGIIRTKDGEPYDIFQGRIIIPILDVNKKVVGFGGRAIEQDRIPKYINSPESSIFSKRFSLFGIDKTKKYITDINEVFIVEGYFDCISLYKHGLKNVVSTLGTSVTEGQLSKLRNYSENITLMLDGDEAGVKSALRLIEPFSELDINGNMVVLPAGHDPDSFIREKGIKEIQKILKNKKPILDYFFDYYKTKYNLDRLEGKIIFIKSVMPYIGSIKDSVKKSLYIKRLSALTGVEEKEYWDSMHNRVIDSSFKNRESATRIIEKKVIGALLHKPELLPFLKIKGIIQYIKDERTKEIVSKMIEYFDEKKNLEVYNFINMFKTDDLKNYVITAVFNTSESDESEAEKILIDYTTYIQRRFFYEESKRITESLAEAEEIGDEKTISELLNKKKEMLKFIKLKT